MMKCKAGALNDDHDSDNDEDPGEVFENSIEKKESREDLTIKLESLLNAVTTSLKSPTRQSTTTKRARRRKQ